jgi:hypothetical protein
LAEFNTTWFDGKKTGTHRMIVYFISNALPREKRILSVSQCCLYFGLKRIFQRSLIFWKMTSLQTKKQMALLQTDIGMAWRQNKVKLGASWLIDIWYEIRYIIYYIIWYDIWHTSIC